MAIYVRKCPCGCQFEYGAADVDETFFDPRDRVTMWYVECPECGDKTGFEKPDPVRYEQELFYRFFLVPTSGVVGIAFFRQSAGKNYHSR